MKKPDSYALDFHYILANEKDLLYNDEKEGTCAVNYRKRCADGNKTG